MPRRDVELNAKGIGALLKSDRMRADLRRRAQTVLDAAKASAPVDTGDYRDSGHLEEDTTDRAVVRVVFDDPKSTLVEAKTGNLARALDAGAGGDS